MKIAEAHEIIAEVMFKFGVPASRWGFLSKPARLTYLGEDRRGLPARYEIRLKRSWSATVLASYLTKCLIAVRRGQDLPPQPTPAARKTLSAEAKEKRKAAAKEKRAAATKRKRQSDLPVVLEDPNPTPKATRKGRAQGKGKRPGTVTGTHPEEANP